MLFRWREPLAEGGCVHFAHAGHGMRVGLWTNVRRVFPRALCGFPFSTGNIMNQPGGMITCFRDKVCKLTPAGFQSTEKLSNFEVELLLGSLNQTSFATRDEQEVAGYARVMERVFESWPDLTLHENHLKQLHAELLQFSEKDSRHRGEYKTHSNHVAAFDRDGSMLGIVFETSSPFDTPFEMRKLLDWHREAGQVSRACMAPMVVVFSERSQRAERPTSQPSGCRAASTRHAHSAGPFDE